MRDLLPATANNYDAGVTYKNYNQEKNIVAYYSG